MWISFYCNNPYIAVRNASEKLATKTAAIPNPCITSPVITKPRELISFKEKKMNKNDFQCCKIMEKIFVIIESLTLKLVTMTLDQLNRMR